MQTETAEFPLHWDEPADAGFTWEFDPMHCPVTVTPLGFDLYMGPFLEGFGMLKACLQNYYMFMSQRPAAGGSPPTADPAAVIAGGRNWREVILPEVRSIDEYYRTTGFDVMSSEALADEIDKLVATRTRCGQMHTMATLPWWLGMSLLIETYKELTGGNELGAVRLVQGHGSRSVDAGQALWRVSRTAGAIPAVRERLRAGAAPAKEALAALASEPAAQPFLDAFAQFLDEFGWRTGLFEFADTTWIEDPTVPLDQLRAYLELDGYDPMKEQARLIAEREEGLGETLARLKPDARERLQSVVDAAAQVVSLQEDHNYYIDQRVGMLPRRLVLAAGRRLVSNGPLAEPDDIFYLRHHEVCAALRGEAVAAGALAGRRKAEKERWSKVTPPPFIGAPPEEAPADEFASRFWGARNLRSDRPGELKGNAASPGIGRGPARVLHSLDESHRLRPGDVLVARTTMPPWTPLFAVASAVVTETGGVLSHAAVTAREFRLPAVLSVQNATTLIRDGQLLEVHGAKGIIKILS